MEFPQPPVTAKNLVTTRYSIGWGEGGQITIVTSTFQMSDIPFAIIHASFDLKTELQQLVLLLEGYTAGIQTRGKELKLH